MHMGKYQYFQNSSSRPHNSLVLLFTLRRRSVHRSQNAPVGVIPHAVLRYVDDFSHRVATPACQPLTTCVHQKTKPRKIDMTVKNCVITKQKRRKRHNVSTWPATCIHDNHWRTITKSVKISSEEFASLHIDHEIQEKWQAKIFVSESQFACTLICEDRTIMLSVCRRCGEKHERRTSARSSSGTHV